MANQQMKALATQFEQRAAQTVDDRGPSPIAAGPGETRVLRTESGTPVTHPEVLEAVAARAGLELAANGKRPTKIICACKAVVVVGARGRIPTTCRACANTRTTEAELDANRESQRVWREKNREVKRHRDRDAYARKKAVKAPDDGLGLPDFEP